MYIQFRADSASSYAVIKTASAAINQAHVLNNFPSPTKSTVVKLARNAAKRTLGESNDGQKEPFEWPAVQRLLIRFGASGQPLLPRLTSFIAALSMLTAARVNEILRLRICDVKVDASGDVRVQFTKRKGRNEFRDGQLILVARAPAHDPVCLVTQLRAWIAERVPLAGPDAPLFPTVPGRQAVSAAHLIPVLSPAMSYNKYRQSLATFLAPILGLSRTDFLARYGTHSARGGALTAAYQRGVPHEVRRRTAGWSAHSAMPLRYEQQSVDTQLSFSRAVMGVSLFGAQQS